MNAPPIGTAGKRTLDGWARRARRAARLAERHAYTRETFGLYLRLLAVQEPAHAQAVAARLPQQRIAEHAVACVAPAVVAAVESAGIAALAAAARPWLRDAAAQDVARWLGGEELPPIGAFFARASAAPVLEALAGEGRQPRPAGHSRCCPSCGGLPQLAFTAAGGDALVTGPLRLCCARCGDAWQGARLRCAACGEADTTRLVSFAAGEQLLHLRADACHSCRRYLVHVDLRRDPEAVPEVDEFLALPLDLHAQEQGFRKVVTNLMGI